MLTFTLREDGLRASIGPCVGGFVRLSIIRLCRELAIPIPAEALDEATDIDTLRDLNLELLIRRGQERQARSDAVLARQAQERAVRERGLPPAVRAKAAALHQQAQAVRTRAHSADRLADFNAEMADARRLEQQAEALLAS